MNNIDTRFLPLGNGLKALAFDVINRNYVNQYIEAINPDIFYGLGKLVVTQVETTGLASAEFMLKLFGHGNPTAIMKSVEQSINLEISKDDAIKSINTAMWDHMFGPNALCRRIDSHKEKPFDINTFDSYFGTEDFERRHIEQSIADAAINLISTIGDKIQFIYPLIYRLVDDLCVPKMTNHNLSLIDNYDADDIVDVLAEDVERVDNSIDYLLTLVGNCNGLFEDEDTREERYVESCIDLEAICRENGETRSD